jgi:CRISPR/Cas system-associated endonuclease Cas1
VEGVSRRQPRESTRSPVVVPREAHRASVCRRTPQALLGPPRNRGATHPVSAMLNYAYGVLVAQTQIRLIAEGYDPTLGIIHDKTLYRGTYPAFALDHMEPMRPLVDQAVLDLINSATFTGADFPIQHDGVCRLHPELARRVAQLALERCEIPIIRAKGRHQRKRIPRDGDAVPETLNSLEAEIANDQ